MNKSFLKKIQYLLSKIGNSGIPIMQNSMKDTLANRFSQIWTHTW